MDEKLDQLKAEIEGWFDALSANYPGYSFTASVNEIHTKTMEGIMIKHDVKFNISTIEYAAK